METGSSYRPRVSRETRSLLAAGVLAVAALWLLARLRFPERPVTPNPVPSVLGQLASGPKYDDLAGEVAQLQARVQPSLLSLDQAAAQLAAGAGVPAATALRLRDDLAVTWTRPGPDPVLNGVTVLGRDAASGLAVARLPSTAPTPAPAPWTPRQLQQSRYLIASDVSVLGVSLRPVFVGSLDPVDSPLWSEAVWAVPAHTDLVPGSFVFTNGADLVGLVIADGERLVIVPGTTVLAAADRLLTMPARPVGTLGVEVQALTPPLTTVTGVPVGVVVTWVDPEGAATKQLMVGDAIESVDGAAIATRRHWDVRMARLSAGETVTLGVRRGGERRDVAVAARAPAARASATRPAVRSLGLTLRTRTRVGAEVIRVERASAADRAGLAAGDVITLVANLHAPTPAQVQQSFGAVEQGSRVMVAVTRGDAHFVTTVER